MARWLALGVLLLTGCALDLGGLGEPQPEAGGNFVVDSGASQSAVPDAGAAPLDSGGPSSPDPVGQDSGGDPGEQDGDDSGDQGSGKGNGNGHHG